MSSDRAPLDPELEAVVDEFDSMGVPPWHSLSIESARQLEDELFSAGTGPSLASVRDLRIEGPGGELPLRLFRPADPDPSVVVFSHGGGWVLGTLDSADDICREIAARANCLVVSVDYRLAPEHPFPAALDDVYAALEWTAEYAASLGADPASIGLAGTSAGGNLAAATAVRARDHGPSVAGQFLLYPITDPRLATESYREHGEGPLLTKADMAWFWDLYLRSPVDRGHPLANLTALGDLSGVAPATVLTAGHDVLRDEGAAYADSLGAADVATEHRHYPSLAHGFLSLTDDVAAADDAMDALADDVRARLG